MTFSIGRLIGQVGQAPTGRGANILQAPSEDRGELFYFPPQSSAFSLPLHTW